MKTSFQNYISKHEAIKILSCHAVHHGSFFADFGDFPAYDKEALYSWLGY